MKCRKEHQANNLLLKHYVYVWKTLDRRERERERERKEKKRKASS